MTAPPADAPPADAPPADALPDDALPDDALPDDALPDDERPVMTVYPSIAATGLGRALGTLYESIPLRIGTATLSSLVFTLPTAPLAALLYFGLKAVGPRYVLTSRRLRTTAGPTGKPRAELPLDEIGRIDVAASFGQRFYKAGDLVIRDHVGGERLRLRGVVRPENFRRTILETRDSLVRTATDRRRIAARHAT